MPEHTDPTDDPTPPAPEPPRPESAPDSGPAPNADGDPDPGSAPEPGSAPDGETAEDGPDPAPASAFEVDDGSDAAPGPAGLEVGEGADGEEAGVDSGDDGGELDALSAAMDADDGVEPRRHWLRYPGVIGALAVVAVLIMVPCGAGVLFLTGAFADHGRYSAAPDACTVLDPATVRGHFGEDLVRGDTVGTDDDSTCDYQGGAATASSTRVHLTVTRYGPKGPLSAPRMAHAGYHDDVAGARHPTRLPGVADEAVSVRTATGVTVYARHSNLVLALSVTGDEPDLRPRTVAAARQIAAELR